MIVYHSTKEGFLNDIATNGIEDIIFDSVKDKLNRSTGKSEISSWKNSLMYMNVIMSDKDIPDDSKVAIEYQIPQTSKRIDFIITGKNDENLDHAVLIELKQWSKAGLTDMDSVVTTFVGGREGEHPHPSYQAWSYAALLNGFNETVYEENIQLKPCAYLHNYEKDEVMTNEFYADYIEKAPIFLKHDGLKLREFIKKYVKHGDDTDIMYRIDHGKIKPSKALADSLASMLKGNAEFVMIDDQKIVYEKALALSKKSNSTNKNVLIVQGGPGTGKSVVAINLLVNLTKMGLLAKYISKNAAPRAVYENKLTGTLKKTVISSMFSGSGSFISTEKDTFDALIVDEAHRLNAKSGMFKNLGENQIKEIIESSKCSIFFVDEDQKVTLSDIGEKEEIIKWANFSGAKVHQLELTSQFRCNGSNGYLAWLDDILQIHETANTTLDKQEYDFKVVSSPNELRDLIYEKNQINNKARLVAGYCWDWVSKNNPFVNDVVIPEFNFEMRWNLASDGNLWILKPESVKEVGCIHTCQGLEVDYIGVIVGDDFVIRNGKVVTDPSKRAKSDSSVKGYKTLLKNNPKEAQIKLDQIIKNTYRTLMTRGMKGCYVYFTDKETENFFRENLGTMGNDKKSLTPVLSPITMKMVRVPLVGSAPAGSPLLGEENVEDYIMVEKSKLKPGFTYFILRVDGDSMNLAGINDGDLVLCRQQLKADTGDRVVSLLGDNVTIKMYGERVGGIRKLLPKSSNKIHQPIIPGEGDTVLGIVQEVLEDN